MTRPGVQGTGALLQLGLSHTINKRQRGKTEVGGETTVLKALARLSPAQLRFHHWAHSAGSQLPEACSQIPAAPGGH